jgi:predicted nucleic acid-binding protein
VGAPPVGVTHLDTSVLVDALTGRRRSAPALTALVADGEPIAVSALVLFEWWRGPRIEAEVHDQEALLPAAGAAPFGAAEATVAATLYRQVRRARIRRLDLAIAACAIVRGARLWTLNPDDFADIPDLVLLGTRRVTP